MALKREPIIVVFVLVIITGLSVLFSLIYLKGGAQFSVSMKKDPYELFAERKPGILNPEDALIFSLYINGKSIRVNDTKEKVIRILGEPNEITIDKKTNKPKELTGTNLYYEGLSIRLSDNMINTILVFSDKYSTNNGIKVGSSFEELKKAFPNGTYFDNNHPPNYLITHAPYLINFNISKYRVSRIEIGAAWIAD